MNESEAIEVLLLRDSRWMFDTLSIMWSLKAKETYEKWFDQIMKVTMPFEAERPQSLEYIIDSYENISSKNITRANRGEITERVYLENVCQKMFQGND